MPETIEQNLATRSGKSLQRQSSLVGLWTLSSRILGFVRESATAAIFGVGPVGGALTFAFTLPNLFRRLFGEGALTAVFLPQYTRTLDGQGETAARKLVSLVFGALLSLLGGLSLLVMAFCFFFPRDWMPSSWGSRDQLSMTLDFLVILFPYVLLVCAYALAMAVLNAHGRFLSSAAAPAVQNLIAIAGLGLVAWLGLSEMGAGYLVAWFFLFSGVVQFAMQFPELKKTRMLVAPEMDWKHPAVKSISREMLPLILGLGLAQINFLVDQAIAIAYLGDGGNQYVSLGTRLLQLPIGIIGVSTVTVTFPLFTRLYAAGQKNTLRIEMDRAVRSIAFLALPAAAGMIALCYPITQVLFEHGKFTAENTAQTAPVIAMCGLAVPALCVVPLLTRVFYAAGDTRLPVKISALLVILNVVLSLLLVHPFRAAGIALATATVSWINLFVLYFALRKLGVPKGSGNSLYLLKMLAASLLCGAAAHGAWFLLAPLGAFWGLGFGILIGMSIYFLSAKFLRLEETNQVLKVLRRQ